MKKSVLVLGAGYGGIFAAAYLCKEGLFDVTIIDRNQSHQLLQQIHHIVSGSKKPGDVTVGIEELFRDENGKGCLSVINAAVTGIDLKRKTVEMQAGGAAEVRQYDHVVISLGAETQYFGIKGAEKHCMPFRSVKDALEIRKKIESLQAGSIIVIGGGGPTGVSLAAAVSEMDEVRDKRIGIKIVDSAENLLPGWDARLAATSRAVLAARGVEIVTRKRIIEVCSDCIVAEPGERIRSDCTVWTAGVKGCCIGITPEVERTQAGRIVVDRHSRIPGFEDAFAIGDISAFELSGSGGGRTAPQLAQFAVRQARFVADNIARKERGERMNDTLSFSQRGHTIAIGKKNLGLLGGLLVTGRMCDYAEDSIVDNFVMEIKNRGQGISAKAAAAAKVLPEDYPAPFNFVTYATSDAFSELMR